MSTNIDSLGDYGSAFEAYGGGEQLDVARCEKSNGHIRSDISQTSTQKQRFGYKAQ